jgi:hypothetical protein
MKRDYDLAALREWESANDVVVPSRGRIRGLLSTNTRQARDADLTGVR